MKLEELLNFKKKQVDKLFVEKFNITQFKFFIELLQDKEVIQSYYISDISFSHDRCDYYVSFEKRIEDLTDEEYNSKYKKIFRIEDMKNISGKTDEEFNEYMKNNFNL